MTTYLAKLPHRAVLEFEGPDTRKFLQGQTTCDLEQLAPTHSLVGAYCNPQGRMVCDFRLLELDGERLLMVLEADSRQAAADTFGKYIVFSKASLRDATDDWCHYALWGTEAATLAGSATAGAGSAWRQGDELWVASEVPNAFEVCLPAAGAADFEARLDGATQADGEQFRLQEIRAGIGHVTGASSGSFLPQQLNYQAVDRINFTKGCYTGQEVVARMHYRGQVKRPMALASTTYSGEVNAGDPLTSAGSDKTVGNVVNAARADDGELWLLASITRDSRAAGAELDGSALAFHSLPYTLDEG